MVTKLVDKTLKNLNFGSPAFNNQIRSGVALGKL